MKPFQCILVATDFGEASERALAGAIDLARRFDAKLSVVHCFEVPSYAYAGMYGSSVDLLTPIREGAERQLQELMARVRQQVPSATGTLRTGVAYDEILGIAKRDHADLIVLGTHGRQGVSRMLLGSVAEKVVRLSPVPVLTVRGEVR